MTLGSINRFQEIESKLLVGIIAEADYRVAMTVAHSSRKASVINAVKGKFLRELFGESPMTFDLKIYISSKSPINAPNKFISIKENQLVLSDVRPKYPQIFNVDNRVKKQFIGIVQSIYEVTKNHLQRNPTDFSFYLRTIYLCKRVNLALLNLKVIIRKTVEREFINPPIISATSLKIGDEIEFQFSLARFPLICIKQNGNRYYYLRIEKGRIVFPEKVYNDHRFIFSIFCEIFRLYQGSSILVRIDDEFLRCFNKSGIVKSYNEIIYTRDVRILTSDLRYCYDSEFKSSKIYNWDPEIFKFYDL